MSTSWQTPLLTAHHADPRDPPGPLTAPPWGLRGGGPGFCDLQPLNSMAPLWSDTAQWARAALASSLPALPLQEIRCERSVRSPRAYTELPWGLGPGALSPKEGGM